MEYFPLFFLFYLFFSKKARYDLTSKGKKNPYKHAKVKIIVTTPGTSCKIEVLTLKPLSKSQKGSYK